MFNSHYLWRTALRFGFLAALAVTTILYGVVQIKKAGHRPLWGDEIYAYQATVKGVGVGSLLLKGAPGQGSPSPLDYLLLKGLDRASEPVRYFGLPIHAYYRLVSLGATLILALLVAVVCWRSLCTGTSGACVVSHVLVFAAFITALFQPLVYYYSAEMRPYALWAGLWLASAVSFFSVSRPGRAGSLVVLTLMALTATASIFQIVALAAAFLMAGLADGRSARQLMREGLCLFSGPVLVSLYYCLQVGHWDYVASGWVNTWADFLRFWGAQAWVPLGCLVTGLICLRMRGARFLAVPALAVSLVYLMGPLVFHVTKAKGFFFAPRQFIYYEAGVPVLLFTCAYLFHRVQDRMGVCARVFFATAVVVAAALGIHRCVRGTIWQAQLDWRADSQFSGVPQDERGELRDLLKSELPAGFCLKEPPKDACRVNLEWIARWLVVRHRALPQGTRHVEVSPKGDGASVIGLSETCVGKVVIPVSK